MGDHDIADYAMADRACLDEPGRYLASTDAWRRFAIWLLYKHFESAAEEFRGKRDHYVKCPPGRRDAPERQ